jgi:hypothetical protein
MSAIVNSNNVIFANGGGAANPVYYVHTADIEFEKVKDTIQNSGVVVPYYNVMGGNYFFNIDTQALAGSKKGYTFVNDSISSQMRCYVWESGTPGEADYATGVDMNTAYYQVPQVSSQTTSTSGLSFYGDTGYNAHYVFLKSNENEGQPMELELPARSESDIFYDAEIGSYDSSDDVGLRIGVKTTTSTAEDYISENPIVFPKTENDNGRSCTFATVLRVKNESYSPMTVYPAVRTDWYGSFPEGSEFWIDEDSIKTRSYPL